MNDIEICQRFQALYNNVPVEDSIFVRKPLLAHYTSLNVFESILKTEEVWLSNPLFMNDLEEVRFGVLEGVALVLRSQEIEDACQTPSRADLFKQAFSDYLRSFESEHAIDLYVFCLSEHDREDKDGVLSMWRGYGGNGNGVAIVFDTGQLGAVEHSPFIISRVHYASSDERIGWLKDMLLTFAGILRDTNISDEKLYIAAYALFERIKVFALFSKHHGFKEEREWRIVYLKERDYENRFISMLHYWIGSQGVEPKLKFKVAPIEGLTADDISLAKIVERIILGPSLSSPLAKAAMLKMFDQLGTPYLKERLYASTIPFRAP